MTTPKFTVNEVQFEGKKIKHTYILQSDLYNIYKLFDNNLYNSIILKINFDQIQNYLNPKIIE